MNNAGENPIIRKTSYEASKRLYRTHICLFRLARDFLNGAMPWWYVLRRDQLQQLCGWKQRAGFLIVEQLCSVFKYLELSARSISDLHFHTFFGCGFAQAPGRATQIESEKAALHFNHFGSSKLLWQQGSCSRESLRCPAHCARSRRRK